jgi:hypothetical protein
MSKTHKDSKNKHTKSKGSKSSRSKAKHSHKQQVHHHRQPKYDRPVEMIPSQPQPEPKYDQPVPQQLTASQMQAEIEKIEEKQKWHFPYLALVLTIIVGICVWYFYVNFNIVYPAISPIFSSQDSLQTLQSMNWSSILMPLLWLVITGILILALGIWAINAWIKGGR